MECFLRFSLWILKLYYEIAFQFPIRWLFNHAFPSCEHSFSPDNSLFLKEIVFEENILILCSKLRVEWKRPKKKSHNKDHKKNEFESVCWGKRGQWLHKDKTKPATRVGGNNWLVPHKQNQLGAPFFHVPWGVMISFRWMSRLSWTLCLPLVLSRPPHTVLSLSGCARELQTLYLVQKPSPLSTWIKRGLNLGGAPADMRCRGTSSDSKGKGR